MTQDIMAVITQDGCYRSNGIHIVITLSVWVGGRHCFRFRDAGKNVYRTVLVDTSLPVGGAVTRSIEADSGGHPFLHPVSTVISTLPHAEKPRAPHGGRQNREEQTAADDDGSQEGEKSGQRYYFVRDLSKGTSQLVCMLTKPHSLPHLSVLLVWVYASISVLVRMSLMDVLARLTYISATPSLVLLNLDLPFYKIPR